MSKKLKPVFTRKDDRGNFCEAINIGSWKSIIYGTMEKGAVMGNHYHKKTEVFFFTIKGRVEIDVINVKTKSTDFVELDKDEGIMFLPYFSHAIKFMEDSIFMMGKSRSSGLPAVSLTASPSSALRLANALTALFSMRP